MKTLLLTLAFIIALGSHVEAADDFFTKKEMSAHHQIWYTLLLRKEYDKRYPNGEECVGHGFAPVSFDEFQGRRTEHLIYPYQLVSCYTEMISSPDIDADMRAKAIRTLQAIIFHKVWPTPEW